MSRILVTGARGYVGSRLVPELLRRGHEVVATASTPPDTSRQPWGEAVTWRVMDAMDVGQVRSALAGVEAVAYLVHALDRRDFGDLDRLAARAMREAVDDAGTRRVVYLSGLVPQVPRGSLSPHIASRLEVEEILDGASASTLSVRAGVVLGAGSTSFEIVRQLASSMLVQPLPSWLRSSVQPVAVTDVVSLLATALEADEPTGAVDIGGPDVVAYRDLLATVAREAHLLRVRLPALPLPVWLVARAAPWFTAAPANTVSSLVASLRHDMVCDPARWWRPDGGGTPVDVAVRESLRRAAPGTNGHRAASTDPYAALRPAPGDATWTSPATALERVTGVRLPLPAVARAAANTAEHRARGVLGALRHHG